MSVGAASLANNTVLYLTLPSLLLSSAAWNIVWRRVTPRIIDGRTPFFFSHEAIDDAEVSNGDGGGSGAQLGRALAPLRACAYHCYPGLGHQLWQRGVDRRLLLRRS